MSLKEIPLKYEYRSDDADLVKDFYTQDFVPKKRHAILASSGVFLPVMVLR